MRSWAKIRHIAITAEDPFVTESFQEGARPRGDLARRQRLAREVYLTDGYINLAIVCWKRTKETPNPYPDGYGLDHFGVHVTTSRARKRAPARPAPFQPPPPVDLSKLAGNTIFFEKKLELAGVKFDLSGHGWATQPEKIALEATAVRKTYTKDGRSLAVLDVERFSVRDGEFVTIIGPSGCGKSTLLHIMGGFIKGESGEIRVHAGSVNGPGPDRGVMFQEFALFPWKTVAGNVAWGLEAQGFQKEQIEETAFTSR